MRATLSKSVLLKKDCVLLLRGEIHMSSRAQVVTPEGLAVSLPPRKSQAKNPSCLESHNVYSNSAGAKFSHGGALGI